MDYGADGAPYTMDFPKILSANGTLVHAPLRLQAHFGPLQRRLAFNDTHQDPAFAGEQKQNQLVKLKEGS
jgi:hypothetical protein